jgi:hypothetical protein
MNRRERIAQMEQELRDRGAEFMVDNGFDEALKESFLEHVLEFENAEHKPMREWLEQSGFDTSAGLPDLLEQLALLGIAVEWADHLSDEELHRKLIERFDDEIALIPGSVLHLEMLASGDDEDDRTWLSYYASDEDRAQWKEQFPDEELPPKKEPLYRREMPEAFRGDEDAS